MPLRLATFLVGVLLLSLSAAAQLPDLRANSIAGPTAIQCGTPFNVTRDITNLGGAVPGGIFSYSIWLSTDNVITPADLQIATASSTTFGLINLTVTLPNTVPAGFYFYGLVVNPASTETNTSNNVVASFSSTQVVAGGPPDLVATSITGPATAAPGQTLNLTRNIGNVGCPLTATFAYDVRISTDTTITTADPVIASFGSNTLGSLQVSATIPGGIASGNYYYALVVIQQTGETNIANNVVVSATTVAIAPPTPTIATVMPNSGPTTGGTVVTIGGTNFVAGAVVRFGGVAATSVNILSSVLLSCVTPPSPTGLPATVLVEVQTANGTGQLVAGFSYGDPWPGSGEDILLQTGVNGTANPTPVKSATPGSSIVVAMNSPLGTFANVPVLLLGQVYPTGLFNPGNVPNFPELHLDPPLALVIVNGTAPSPFGNIVFPPGGAPLSLTFSYPGGLSGYTGRVQAFALTGAAVNGFFAASSALEVAYP